MGLTILKSILFAYSVLSSEVADSFIWLFQQFLECMGNAPNAIITYKHPVINVIIPKVFRMTFHHLCKWHITYEMCDKTKCLKEQGSHAWVPWDTKLFAIEIFEEKL